MRLRRVLVDSAGHKSTPLVSRSAETLRIRGEMWTNAVHKSGRELWTDAVHKYALELWPNVGHKSKQELWPNVGHNFEVAILLHGIFHVMVDGALSPRQAALPGSLC